MARDAVAIPVGARSRLAVAVASALGLAAFCWPFVLAPGRFGDTAMAPLFFGVLLLVVVMVVMAEVADGGIDAKAIAMLGVLSAVGAALRPLGAGTAGIETEFFLLILAGRVFGAGFGFVLGCTTLFSSALITGGVGPWMPYQMFASAWVGMFAGMLPPARGRREILLLAAYGAVAAYLFGFLTNLSFWPFTVDPHSTISYLPGASLVVNIQRYLAFDVATSLGWDTGRAVTNVALLVATGPIVLATLRRASRRAAFDAPVAFAPGAGEPARASGTVVEDEDAPDVPAGTHVVVPVVDPLERVGAGHQPVEVKLPHRVQLQQLGDGLAGVGRTEEGADELALEEGQHDRGEVDGRLEGRVHVGDDDPGPLAPELAGRSECLPVAHTHGHDDHVVSPVPGGVGQ